jgi:hypothetical protein
VAGLQLPPTYGVQQAPVFDMGTALTAAARTTTQWTPDINTLNFKGITVILDASVIGTASLTVVVEGKDYSNSGNYWPLLTSGAITAIGTTAHTLYPGIFQPTTQPANGNSAVSTILPVWLRIRVAVGNANPASYSVGAILTT